MHLALVTKSDRMLRMTANESERILRKRHCGIERRKRFRFGVVENITRISPFKILPPLKTSFYASAYQVITVCDKFARETILCNPAHGTHHSRCNHLSLFSFCPRENWNAFGSCSPDAAHDLRATRAGSAQESSSHSCADAHSIINCYLPSGKSNSFARLVVRLQRFGERERD